MTTLHREQFAYLMIRRTNLSDETIRFGPSNALRSSRHCEDDGEGLGEALRMFFCECSIVIVILSMAILKTSSWSAASLLDACTNCSKLRLPASHANVCSLHGSSAGLCEGVTVLARNAHDFVEQCDRQDMSSWPQVFGKFAEYSLSRFTFLRRSIELSWGPWKDSMLVKEARRLIPLWPDCFAKIVPPRSAVRPSLGSSLPRLAGLPVTWQQDVCGLAAIRSSSLYSCQQLALSGPDKKNASVSQNLAMRTQASHTAAKMKTSSRPP
jgi:hypothetical protein